MKRSYFILVAILVIAFNTTSAWANTYYVSTQGNDINPGSSDSPWKTLQHAVDTIAPGDVIIVRAGTYVGCRIGKSGQQGAVKTLKADTGAKVLINAAGPANRHQSNIEIELFDDTVSYWVVDGFEVANGQRYGIDIRSTDYITIQNCYVHNSVVTGIFLAFSYHPVIQFNESASNGEHGIYQSNSGDYPTIRGNKLHHNFACGLHMNGDASFQPGDGIISFGLIERNIVWENGTGGGSGINFDGGSDNIVRNNLLYNNHASGISLYAIDAAQGSSRNKIYNNTIIQAPGSRWCINIPAADVVASPTGNVIRNNILYNPDSFRGSITTYGSAISGFSSDYNIVVNHLSTDGGDTSISLSSWRAFGYDLNSIIATPDQLFVDPANNDYHLKLNSLAIGAGIQLADVTDDLEGNPRGQNRGYDIGCYTVDGANLNPPEITEFSPGSGAAGSSVTIWGVNFTGAKTVKFNGLSASFSLDSDTQITAIVPATATSGPISLSTPAGNATSSGIYTVVKPPTITSFTPALGTVGTNVTISGTNFTNATNVKFNGTDASFTVVTATSIKATLPVGASTGKISVTTAGGTATSTGIFKVPPRISGFTPNSGIAGESVTINGSNFGNSPTVKFGTIAAVITSTNNSQLIVTIPTTASTGKISVTTVDGTAISATDFIVIKPPTISGYTPAMGGVGTNVTISGTNLSSVTDVKFNGVSTGSITVVNATSIKVSVPTGATTGKISVTNRAATAQSIGIFKVLPKIGSVTPNSGLAGESVTVNGSNFGNSPTVKFGTIIATVTSATDTQITTTIPANAITGKISVVTVDGTGISTSDFIVIRPPTISSYSPGLGAVGTIITISGTNLSSVTEVSFNGVSAGAPTIITATSIKSTLPAGATTGKISVTNRAGTALSVGIFKVLPKIIGFSTPSALPGETITLTGMNFTGATAIRFGSIAATTFTVDSDTQITVTVPATALTSKISVITPSGTGISTDNFIVIKLPTISSFSPPSAKVGTVVTINGANVSTATDVKFGNTSITDPITVVSATSIKVVVPVGATTGKLTVTNRAGTSAPSVGTFTVLP